jgi:hypothetical protein
VRYVEGIVALKSTKVPGVSLSFMGFFMRPEQYAAFVN